MSTGNATQFDDNFDWTTGQDGAAHQGVQPGYPQGASSEFGGPDPSQPLDPDSFEFAPIAPVNTAEEAEANAASREYRDIPVGEHLLVVTGFHGYPQPKNRTGYFRGQFCSWTSYSVGVRLAMASDPQATALDFFDLPPIDPNEVQFYQHASKNPDGKNAGFHAEKFTHFISRLGWPFPKGSPIPIEACKIGNWKNRQIIATIEMGRVNRDKIDQTTGMPFPPRPQVKLFSFRPAESTVMGHGQPAHPAAQAAMGGHAPPMLPGGRPQAHQGHQFHQGQPGQARPAGAPQGHQPAPPSFSNRGLGNI